jgi:hypothetical protein
MKVLYAIIILLTSMATAHSSIVEFNGAPSLSWDDGYFSNNLYNTNDGFYQNGSINEAANGFGQSGEKIYFNQPSFLNSFELMPFVGHIYWDVVTTVSEYDSSGNLLGQQMNNPNAINFDTFNIQLANVSSMAFTFNSPYFNGPLPNSAWYLVRNITYNESIQNSIPEPSSISLFGLGLLSIIAARRKNITVQREYAGTAGNSV